MAFARSPLGHGDLRAAPRSRSGGGGAVAPRSRASRILIALPDRRPRRHRGVLGGPFAPRSRLVEQRRNSDRPLLVSDQRRLRSPDGTRVAFITEGHILCRLQVALTATCWSRDEPRGLGPVPPDGQWIGFFLQGNQKVRGEVPSANQRWPVVRPPAGNVTTPSSLPRRGIASLPAAGGATDIWCRSGPDGR